MLTMSSDLADAFPQGQYAGFFRSDLVTQLIKEVRTSQEYSTRTKETARWAREQVKRQTANGQGIQMS